MEKRWSIGGKGGKGGGGSGFLHKFNFKNLIELIFTCKLKDAVSVGFFGLCF